MTAGTIVDLTIARLGGQGDGIGRWRGEPVFVPFTLPQERVRVRLGARRGGGQAGEVVERLAAGTGGASPACRHFGRCGGCALQHVEPALYEAVKLGALGEALARAGIDPGVIQPLRRVPPGRRRARLGLMRPADAHRPVRIGLRERFRHDLVDLLECPVLEPGLWALVAMLRRRGAELVPPGGAAEIVLTRADGGIDLLIEAPHAPDLGALEALAGLAAEADLARILWRHDGRETPIVERRAVRVTLSGVAVALPPGAFLQASEEAAEILAEETVAALAGRHRLVDLYAGLGTLSFALAPAHEVHAVEGDEAACMALARAAARLPQVSVERRDLARDPLSPEALGRFDAAVFDPPRAGAPTQARMLARSSLDTVVALSCNPATFARDARALMAGGFRALRVVPVDQFVWTPHLELVAVFRR